MTKDVQAGRPGSRAGPGQACTQVGCGQNGGDWQYERVDEGV